MLEGKAGQILPAEVSSVYESMKPDDIKMKNTFLCVRFLLQR